MDCEIPGVDGMMTNHRARPEPVEGLSFFCFAAKIKGQGFDKLSLSGFGGAR
jgi:hypothetical protein